MKNFSTIPRGGGGLNHQQKGKSPTNTQKCGKCGTNRPHKGYLRTKSSNMKAELTSAGSVCIGQLSFFTAQCMSKKDNEIPRNADFRVTSKFY